MMFAAPPERDLEWSDRGVEGAQRFLRRVWRQVTEDSADDSDHASEVDHKPQADVNSGKDAGGAGYGISTEGLLRITHQSIKKVTEDFERLTLNTAVSQLMELSNYIGKYLRLPEECRSQDALNEARRTLVSLLNPFAPHMAHELWQRLGQGGMVEEAGWPEYDQELIKEKVITLVIQVDGKVRDRINVPVGCSDQELTEKALTSEKVVNMLGGKAKAKGNIAKVIVVKDKLVNIVTKR